MLSLWYFAIGRRSNLFCALWAGVTEFFNQSQL
uniref:Uncharacterized protein n=1 Tax=Anguilla anguilla TaxID=7936 RepID=A0A0E9U9P1_ANGAN